MKFELGQMVVPINKTTGYSWERYLRELKEESLEPTFKVVEFEEEGDGGSPQYRLEVGHRKWWFNESDLKPATSKKILEADEL